METSHEAVAVESFVVRLGELLRFDRDIERQVKGELLRHAVVSRRARPTEPVEAIYFFFRDGQMRAKADGRPDGKLVLDLGKVLWAVGFALYSGSAEKWGSAAAAGGGLAASAIAKLFVSLDPDQAKVLWSLYEITTDFDGRRTSGVTLGRIPTPSGVSVDFVKETMAKLQSNGLVAKGSDGLYTVSTSVHVLFG